MSGTLTQYVSEIKHQRDLLVQALASKDVYVSQDETFNTLIPKVENIKSGGSGGLSCNLGVVRPKSFTTITAGVTNAEIEEV